MPKRIYKEIISEEEANSKRMEEEYYRNKEPRPSDEEKATIADCSKCVKNFCGFYWKHQKEFHFDKHGDFDEYLKSIKCPLYEERELSDWGTEVPIM